MSMSSSSAAAAMQGARRHRVNYTPLDYADVPFTRTSEGALSDPRDGWAFPLRTTKAWHLAATSRVENLIDPLSWADLSATGVVISGGQLDPAGGTDAFLVTDNAATTEWATTTSGVYPSGNALWFFAWVKQDLVATNFSAFQLDISGVRVEMAVHLGTGALNANSGTVTQMYSTIHDGFIFIAFRYAGAAGAAVFISFIPARGTSFPTASTAATGSATVYGVCLLNATILGDYDVNPTPWAAANEPRIFADGAILLEGTRTNFLRSSVDANVGAYWGLVGGATKTRSALTAPDGATAVAADLTMAAAGDGTFNQTNAFGLSQSGTMSVFARMATGTGSIRLQWLRNDGTLDTSTDLPVTDTWQRFQYRVTNSVAGAITQEFQVINGSDGAARTVTIYGGQVEGTATAYESSQIRTTNASAVRANDLFTLPAADVPPLLRTRSQEWVVWPSFSSSANLGGGSVLVHYVFTYSGGASIQVGLRFRLEIAGTGGVQVINHASGATIQILGITWNEHQRLSCTYNPTTGEMTLSGFTTGDGTYAAIGTIDAFEGDLRLGRVGGTSSFFQGVIERPRLV